MISKRQMMEVTLLLFQNLFKVKEVSRSGYPVVRFIYRVICFTVPALKNESFGAVKMSQFFSGGNFNGNEPKNDQKWPEMTFLDHESNFLGTENT